MGWYGFSNTGACCCAVPGGHPCVLTSDDFDRADDTDPGPDWDEVIAGGAISGNTLAVTSPGQIIADQANPDGPYTYITVDVKLNSGGAQARVFVGWASSTSYLYCTVTSSSITVGRQGGSGGSASKSVSLAVGSFYTLVVCFNGTHLIARINGVEVKKDSLSAPGTKHGVGSSSGTVVFDNFVARRVKEACEACASLVPTGGCSSCVENEFNQNWSIDIQGVGTLEPFCDDCGNVNGLYIVNTPIVSSCLREVAFAEVADVCHLQARIRASVAGTVTVLGVLNYVTDVRVTFRSDVSQVWVRWRKVWGPISDPDNKPICSAAIDCDLVADPVDDVTVAPSCTGAATITITPL